MDHDVVASILKRSGPSAKRRTRMLVHCLTFMDRAAGRKMVMRESNAKGQIGNNNTLAVSTTSSGVEGTLSPPTHVVVGPKEQVYRARCLQSAEALGVILYLLKAPRFVFVVGEKGAIIRSPDRCKVWRRLKNPELLGAAPGGSNLPPQEVDSPQRKNTSTTAAPGGRMSENGTKLLDEDELTAILNLLPQKQTTREELADLGEGDEPSQAPPAGGGARAANAITARALLALGEADNKKSVGAESTSGSVATTQLGAPCPDLHGVACFQDSVVVVGATGFVAVSHDKGLSFKQIPFLVNMEKYNTRQAEEFAGNGGDTGKGPGFTPVLPPSPKLNLRGVAIVPVDIATSENVETVGEGTVPTKKVKKPTQQGRVFFYGGSYLFSFLLTGVADFKAHQNQQYSQGSIKSAATRLGLDMPAPTLEGASAYSWQSEGDMELVQKFLHPVGMLKVMQRRVVVSTQNALHFGVSRSAHEFGSSSSTASSFSENLPSFVTVAHSIGLIRDVADVTDVYSDAEMLRTMGKLGDALVKQSKEPGLSETGALAAPKASGSSKSYSYAATTVIPVDNEAQSEFVSAQLFPSSQRPRTRVIAVLGTNGPLVSYDYTSQLFITQARAPPADARVPTGKIPVTICTNVHKFVYVPFVQSNVHDRVGLAVQRSSRGITWVRSTMGGLCVSTDAGEKFSDPSQAYTGELASLDDSTLVACNLKKAVVLSEDHGHSWQLLALPANLKVATLHSIAVME